MNPKKMPKRKRESVDYSPSKKDMDNNLSLHTLGSLQDIHNHLGPGTRVELISIDRKKTFPVDKMGFPECFETQVRGQHFKAWCNLYHALLNLVSLVFALVLQEILSPVGEERLALVQEVGSEYQIILVMEWNPLHRFFYLQYLTRLTTKYCKAKDSLLNKDKNRKTVRARTCVCPKGVRLCECQGDNQNYCGRTYTFGEHFKCFQSRLSFWESPGMSI